MATLSKVTKSNRYSRMAKVTNSINLSRMPNDKKIIYTTYIYYEGIVTPRKYSTVVNGSKGKVQNSMSAEFFMPMIPPTVTAQEHKVAVRHGKPIIYDTPEIKDAKSKLIAHLINYVVQEPFTSGVRLMVKWCFPKGNHKNGEYRITKPDTDNLQKMLKDCMTFVGFWKDDCIVASEICEKFWADIPGIYIKITEL